MTLMFLKLLINILDIIFHVDCRIQFACFNIIIFFYLYVLYNRVFSSGCQIYRNEMENARRYSSYFIYGWTSACIYGTLHWCANPLLLGFWTVKQMNSTNHTFITRSLPFIAWYPFNTDNIYNYICLYFMQIIGGISSSLGIVCFDCFYVTMLLIICAQFQYINTILTRINFNDKYDWFLFYFFTSVSLNKFSQSLKYIIGFAACQKQCLFSREN